MIIQSISLFPFKTSSFYFHDSSSFFTEISTIFIIITSSFLFIHFYIHFPSGYSKDVKQTQESRYYNEF